MKERADKLLVARGLAASREKAQAIIMAGEVLSSGGPVSKPGQMIDIQAEITIKEPPRFVGRGGLKLEEALEVFGIDVGGLAVADIGSSTGGFTDCLLQRGARKVFAVDVDTRQLDRRLRADPRVILLEKNARFLTRADFVETPDAATLDVSFISILKIMPALHEILDSGSLLLALVKPQFEAERSRVGKKGIVRDSGVHAAVLGRVTEKAFEIGFGLKGLLRCSTRGQKGNIEFFARFERGRQGLPSAAAGVLIQEVTRNEKN
jgi:23S rRNA (cytidine1920-2'-O)/16S rRNA (cytidine1409-2'-O)-methyltransferase